MSPLDEVAKVADAVLFEGYLLYPYRASAQKNQLRWQWGVLTPPGYPGEPAASRTETLLEPGPDATLHIRLRFLQLQARTVQDSDGNEVDELRVGDRRYIPWEEGVTQEVDAQVKVDELCGAERCVPFIVPDSITTEDIVDGDGSSRGLVTRRTWGLAGALRLLAEPLPGPFGALRLRLVVENSSTADDPDTPLAQAPREVALRRSLVAAHTMLAVSPGSFLSLTDPPEWAAPAAAACVNEHVWPVLAGPPERSDLLLCTPIILGDHPQLAPESPTNLFDGCEIDEILSLRTMVLTDEEKAEARATDPRAAAVVDSIEDMPPEIWERLHGAIRSLGPTRGEQEVETETEHVPWWDPAADASVNPDTDTVVVDGHPVARGSRVLLRPGSGGDAQDLFLRGMPATVEAVLHDVDGSVHLAVSVDGDPATEMHIAHGRFRYFRPDEVEVLV